MRVLSLLLSTGRVDMDRLGPEGDTPLVLACSHGHASCVDVLLLAGARASAEAMLKACARGHATIVERLLTQDGMHLDFLASNGATCLMLAAGGGHALLIHALLKRGVALGWAGANGVHVMTDLNGDTALHHAAAAPDEDDAADVVFYLLEWGGPVALHILQHVTNCAGQTPLEVACSCGSEQAARLMIEAAPECVNARNPITGFTPLAVASRLGFSNLVRLLLRVGGEFK